MGVNGLASPLVWWAILLIIASFVSWLYVHTYIPLTIAFPFSRVVDILVPLGCWIFLGEFISTLRCCGIALVVIGLALVAKPFAQIEESLLVYSPSSLSLFFCFDLWCHCSLLKW